MVGERGVTLSGGQRQRVAIARALITRPRLLLLADCLSAVDTATQRVVLEALPDTTLLFATHRLAAAELCDRVVVLDGGRVVETGTPAELAARGGRKAKESKRQQDRILFVAAFQDPLREMDKLHDLYESLVEARREVGDEAVPFHKFADLVKSQVKKLRHAGSPEVAFRVAVQDRKVKFTARALKGVTRENSSK